MMPWIPAEDTVFALYSDSALWFQKYESLLFTYSDIIQYIIDFSG